MAIAYHSKTEIEGIRRAGRVVMDVLDVLRDNVRPGVTTGELDAIARRELDRRGAVSNFLGYRPAKGIPPFPGVICASVNDVIVHGIPGSRTLVEGDIIAIDMGAIVDGWHGDSAITVPVGRIAPEAQRLLGVTQEALRRGIAAARPGNHVLDIATAVQAYVEQQGFSVVRQYAGHGIGRALHEDPWVPNYVEPGTPNPKLRPGMTFCVEPMVNAGRAATHEWPDHWTVTTKDGSLSAHFEHTIAVTQDAPEILTGAA
ncbi:MAG: type I methionyl aminopeptidase [Ktedonobacterales bacterium]